MSAPAYWAIRLIVGGATYWVHPNASNGRPDVALTKRTGRYRFTSSREAWAEARTWRSPWVAPETVTIVRITRRVNP